MSAPAGSTGPGPAFGQFDDSVDCANALWLAGYNSGCRDVAFWASSMRDPGEIRELVEDVTAEPAGPTVHTFRGHPLFVTRRKVTP